MSLEVVKTRADLRRALAPARREGARIGFVPTMGALHEGHAALIRRAHAECAWTVVSIFVNPIQFDRADDYERYARTLEADVALCRVAGAQVVFAPPVEEMYPEPEPKTFVEVTELTKFLCGQYRGTHFRGVATVVAKLFNLVQPDRAYFGEKDAQQLAVIRRMVLDLNFPVEILGVPTVREPDGLALSSRNRRLGEEERRIAPALYRALRAAVEVVERGGAADEARAAALAVLGAFPAIEVEYLEVVDEATMQPVAEIRGPVRIAAAVWLGGTRLIDNLAATPSLAR